MSGFSDRLVGKPKGLLIQVTQPALTEKILTW